LLLAVGAAYCYYRRQPVAEKDILGYHELKDMNRNGPGALINPKIMYRVIRNVKIRLHEGPDSNSAKIGKELAYGDTFEVDETKVCSTANGGGTQTFLHLVTGGWAFEFHPKDGNSVCELWSDKEATAEAQKRSDKEHSELKTDLKRRIASTESDYKAAEASNNFVAFGPLKKHLAELKGLLDQVRQLKPTLSMWSSSNTSSAAEQHVIMQQLNKLRLSIPDKPRASLLDCVEEFDMGVQFADDSIYTSQKFTVSKLLTGRAVHSAHGVAEYMGIDSKQEATLLLRGVAAIREEFRSNGTKEQLAIVEYILDQPAKEEEERSNDGHNTATRDKGHTGMYLKDFLAFGDAVTAKLEEADIAALRIYTSQAFRCINDPLRSGEKPHPFAATTLFLSKGLKKLRSVNATNTRVQKEEVFWRGMKNLELTEDFKKLGGTELGCMSTSTSMDIVAGYAKSEQPLVFRLVSDSFMTCGIDISWLSIYPNEAEVLYPPLTFLQYLGQRPIKNSRGIVVDVKPSFS
jgi:hypothetical protein